VGSRIAVSVRRIGACTNGVRIGRRRRGATIAMSSEPPARGFVWIVIGRRGPLPHERYVIAVYGHEEGAQAQAARWRRQYLKGGVDVERYAVLDGSTLPTERSPSMAKPNYVTLVQAAKAEIVARGVDVDATECNRFQITKLAASRMAAIDPDVGLLATNPPHNNCDGYAVDVVCWKDGVIVDILGKGNEGPNTPLWQENANPVDPARWRPAPAIITRETPPPRPAPATDSVAMLARLDRLETIVDALRVAGGELEILRKQLALLDDEVQHLQRRRYVSKFFGMTIVSVPE
jgi:hypothetical protein